MMRSKNQYRFGLLSGFVLASCCSPAAGQPFDVILIDFGDPFGLQRQIFDASGVRDTFNFLWVEEGSMTSLTGSPGGAWWTLKVTEDEFGRDFYLGGSAQTARTVLAEEDQFELSNGEQLPSLALVFADRMHINNSGKFAIAIDFFPDFITGENPSSLVQRRGARVVTGQADAFGSKAVDFLVGEGQLLSDFFTSPEFHPDTRIGATDIYVNDSDFLGMPTTPTICGPSFDADPGPGVTREETVTTSFFSEFEVYGVANDGTLLFETALNGPGIVNSGGEIDVDGNYYKSLDDCRFRTIGPPTNLVLFQGFGGPDPRVVSRSNATSFVGSPFFHASYVSLPAGPGQDANATMFSAEARPTVSEGVFTIDQLVRNGQQLLAEGQQFLGPNETTALDTVSQIITSFTTPLGDNYATIERNIRFEYFEIDPDFGPVPVFISDESDTRATKELPGFGALLKNGELLIREGDPITNTPGETRTWDDPDVILDPLAGETVFDENGEMIVLEGRDGTSVDTFVSGTSDGFVSIGAVVGNRRGDIVFVGDIDDQDPNTRGTFAAVLNQKRVILEDGAPVEIDAVAPFGQTETYYIGKDIIRSLAGERVNLFLSDDGYLYLLTTIVDTPNLPLDFTEARNAIVGEAFLRFRAFEVLDIDRNGVIEQAVDIQALVTNIENETLGAGDFNLNSVIDAFDLFDALNEFDQLD